MLMVVLVDLSVGGIAAQAGEGSLGKPSPAGAGHKKTSSKLVIKKPAEGGQWHKHGSCYTRVKQYLRVMAGSTVISTNKKAQSGQTGR
ncbi:hypothetical protein C5B78_04615 [Aeromonas salmonicida]|nr:hypothetical protein C5B78_04615 [Aeromonas salmonicida]